jgi:plastocyanin
MALGMRTRFAAVLVLALAALPSAAAADRAVTIAGTGFAPKDVTVAAGDSVTWRNADTRVHQVNFEKVPCNLTIAPTVSASCTFRAGGKFTYRDASYPGGAFRGSVTVTGPRTSVTLGPSRKTAPFLAPVTLTGVISSQATGESVAVSAQECGKTTFTQLGSATTTSGGNWTFTVKPGLKTVYRARWRATDSPTATVDVSPKLRLTRLRSRFTVRVSASHGFIGKLVLFQRYRAGVRRWATVKRVKLGAVRPPVAGTIVTSASFRSSVRRGWRVRTLFPQAQAGVCYLSGTSNTLRIR